MRKRSITPNTDSTHDTDQVEMRLPKFTLPKFAHFSTKNYIPLLIVGMIIASFLLGMETSKIQYLQTELKNAAANTANSVANAAAPAAQPTTPPASGDIKPVTDNDIIRGNVNAKVTLVEYSDEECPFCKQFHPTMLQLMQKYGDQIRWVYRTYPLPFHQNADKEAQATLCVQELGGNDIAWNFIDKIFDRTTSNGTGFALTALGPLAAEVGLDQTAFQNCLDSNKYEQTVKDETADGAQAGVNGTPTTILLVDGQKPQVIVGAQPIDQLSTAIDAALK